VSAEGADVTELDEYRLVRLASAGDRSAFERLYRKHAGRIYALCLRMTGRASEAEEMTQEAFIRAWERLGSFEGRSLFSSWLHRLAVNVVLNERRSRGGSRAFEALDGHHDRTAASPRGSEGGGDLERAIAALPEAARQVFVLHEVHGYTHEEISEVAGIAVGTSRAHLHRARTLLRGALTS